MNKSLFAVRARTYADGDKDSMATELTHVVAQDAEAAFAKAKAHHLREKWDWKDDNGKKHTSRITRVDLLSVAHVADIDLI